MIRSETQATIDRGRERTKLGPFGWDIEIEVEADAGPPDRVAFGQWGAVPARGLPGSGSVRQPLHPCDVWDGTELRGLWRLLTPLIAMEADAGPKRELGRLKAQVEQQPR